MPNRNYTSGYKPQHPAVLARFEASLEIVAARLRARQKNLENRENKLVVDRAELQKAQDRLHKQIERVAAQERKFNKLMKGKEA